MKKLLLILLCLPMIGFGQELTSFLIEDYKLLGRISFSQILKKTKQEGYTLYRNENGGELHPDGIAHNMMIFRKTIKRSSTTHIYYKYLYILGDANSFLDNSNYLSPIYKVRTTIISASTSSLKYTLRTYNEIEEEFNNKLIEDEEYKLIGSNDRYSVKDPILFRTNRVVFDLLKEYTYEKDYEYVNGIYIPKTVIRSGQTTFKIDRFPACALILETEDSRTFESFDIFNNEQ